MIRGFIAIGLVGVIWLQAGCAQILVPGTMAGAGELYRYTTTNVAKQTFVGNMDQMTAATKIALKNMKMELGSVNRGDTETVLHASASALEIRIQLEPVTPATTRVTVNATKDHWIKDKATANEILSQIGNSLKTKISAAKHFSSVFIKNECDRPIRVAVYYLAGPEGSETWETRGWFFMKPGNKKQIAETKTDTSIFMPNPGMMQNWSGPETTIEISKASDTAFLKSTSAVPLSILPRHSPATST